MPGDRGATLASADEYGEYSNARIGPGVIVAEVVDAGDGVPVQLPVTVPEPVGMPTLCVALGDTDTEEDSDDVLVACGVLVTASVVAAETSAEAEPLADGDVLRVGVSLGLRKGVPLWLAV